MADGNAASREDGNLETIDAKISKLIREWATLNVSADGSLLQKTQMLFRNTARLVLSAVWAEKVNALSKSNMTLILHQCIQTVASVCAESKALIEALSELLADPWGNPALRKILSAEEKTEKTSLHDYYCTTENPEVLWLRLEVLESTQCEDLAQKLCSCCLHCGPLKGNEKLQLMNVRLQFRLGRIDQLTKEVKNYTCSEGRQLITRILESEEFDRFELAECLSQVLLVRDMVLSSGHESTKEFMNQWIEMHISKGTEMAILRQQVLKLCFLSTTSAHFYLMVDLLHSKFGDSLLQLYVELYIRALTVDINFMENARLTDPKEDVEELENHVADTLCKLAGFLGNHPTLARECILSAFSISPSKERLAKLYAYANEEPNDEIEPQSPSLTNGVPCIPCSGECHCNVKGECRRNLHEDTVEHKPGGSGDGEALLVSGVDIAAKSEPCFNYSDVCDKDVNISNLRNTLGQKLSTLSTIRSTLERKLSTETLSPLQLSPESIGPKLPEDICSEAIDDSLPSFLLDHTNNAPSEDADFSAMVMLSECVVYTENVATTDHYDIPSNNKNELSTPQVESQMLVNMTEALSIGQHSSDDVDTDDEKLDTAIPVDIYTANSHILDYAEEKLPTDLLRDLTIVLDEPRSKILTWDLNWHELESRCKLYLEQRALPPNSRGFVRTEEQLMPDISAVPTTEMGPATIIDRDDAMIAIAELLVNDLPSDRFSSQLLNSVPSLTEMPEKLSTEDYVSSQDYFTDVYSIPQSPKSESNSKVLPVIQSPELETIDNVFPEMQSSEFIDNTISVVLSPEKEIVGSDQTEDEEAAACSRSCLDQNITTPLIANNTNVKLGATNMNPTVVISQSDISTARKVLDERSSFLKELLLSSKAPPSNRQASCASGSVARLSTSNAETITLLGVCEHQNEVVDVGKSRPSAHALLRASRPFERSCLPQIAIPVIPVQKVVVAGLPTLDMPNLATKPMTLNETVPYEQPVNLPQNDLSLSSLSAVRNLNGVVSSSKGENSVSTLPKTCVSDAMTSAKLSPSRPHPALPYLRTAFVSVQKLDLNATVRKLDAHLSASASAVSQFQNSQPSSHLLNTSCKTSVGKKCEPTIAVSKSLASSSNKTAVTGKLSSSPTRRHVMKCDETSGTDGNRLLLKSVSLPPSVQKVTVHHPMVAVLTDKLSSLKPTKLNSDASLHKDKKMVNNLTLVSNETPLKQHQAHHTQSVIKENKSYQAIPPEFVSQPRVATVELPGNNSEATVTGVTHFTPSVFSLRVSNSSNQINLAGKSINQEAADLLTDSTVSQHTALCIEPEITEVVSMLVQSTTREVTPVSANVRRRQNVTACQEASFHQPDGNAPIVNAPVNMIPRPDMLKAVTTSADSFLSQTLTATQAPRLHLRDIDTPEKIVADNEVISLFCQSNVVDDFAIENSMQCQATTTSQEGSSRQLAVSTQELVTIGEVVSMLVQSNIGEAVTVSADCSRSEAVSQEQTSRPEVSASLDFLLLGEPNATQTLNYNNPNVCMFACAELDASDITTSTVLLANPNSKNIAGIPKLNQGLNSTAAINVGELSNHTRPLINIVNAELNAGTVVTGSPTSIAFEENPSSEPSIIGYIGHPVSGSVQPSHHEVSTTMFDASQMPVLTQDSKPQVVAASVAQSTVDTLAKLNGYQANDVLTNSRTPHSVVLAEPCTLTSFKMSEPNSSLVAGVTAGTKVEKSISQHSLMLPALKCNQVFPPLPLQSVSLRSLPIAPAKVNIFSQVRMTPVVQPTKSLTAQQETSAVRGAVICAESQLLCATTGVGPPSVVATKVTVGNDPSLVPTLNSLPTTLQLEGSGVMDQGSNDCLVSLPESFKVSGMTAHDIISNAIMNEFSEASPKTVSSSVIVNSSQLTPGSPLPPTLLPNGMLVPACAGQDEIIGADVKNCAVSPLKTLVPTNDFETNYKRFLLGGKQRVPQKVTSTSLPASPATSAPFTSSQVSTSTSTTTSAVLDYDWNAAPLSTLVPIATPIAATVALPVYTPKLTSTNSNLSRLPTVSNISIPPRVSSAPPRATSPLLQSLVTTATQVWEVAEAADKKSKSLLFPSKAERRKWVIVRNQHGGTECKKINTQFTDVANGTAISEPLLQPSPRVTKPRSPAVSQYSCTAKGVVLPPFNNFTASSSRPTIGQPQLSMPFVTTQHRAQSPRSLVTVTPSIRAPVCSTMSETRIEDQRPSSTTFHSVDDKTHTVMSATNLHHSPKVKPVILPVPAATDPALVDTKNASSSMIVGSGVYLEKVVSSSAVRKPPAVVAHVEQSSKPCTVQKEKKKAKKPTKPAPVDLQKLYEENANVAKILQNYQEEFKKHSASSGSNSGTTNSKAKTSKQTFSNSVSSNKPLPPTVSSPKPRNISPSSVSSSSSSSLNASPITALCVGQALPPVSSIFTRLPSHPLVVPLPIPKQPPSQSQTIKRHYLPPENPETPGESEQQDEPKKKKVTTKKDKTEPVEKKAKKDKAESPKIPCPVCNKKMCSSFSVKRHLKHVHKVDGEQTNVEIVSSPSSSSDIKTNLIHSANSKPCETTDQNVCASSAVADIDETHQLKTVNMSESITSSTNLCINKKLNSPPRPSDLDNIDLDTLLNEDFDYPTSGFTLFGDPIAEDGLERNGSDEDLMKTKEEEDISRAFGLFCDPPREQSALDGELSDTPFALFSDPEMPSNLPPGCSPVGDASRPECLSPIDSCRQISSEEDPGAELYVEDNKLHGEDPVTSSLSQPDSCSSAVRWSKDRDAETSSVECEQVQEGIAAIAKSRTRARKTNAPCRCCDSDSTSIAVKKCRKDAKVLKSPRTATRNRTKETRRSSVRTNRR